MNPSKLEARLAKLESEAGSQEPAEPVLVLFDDEPVPEGTPEDARIWRVEFVGQDT